ncbi:MAG: response regulator, partial [Chloroflexota bacterium]
MPARTIVADYQPVIRAGIVAMLGRDPTLQVVAQTGDGPQTLAICRQLHPDLVVLAFRLPLLSGPALTRILAASPRAPRILILSNQADVAVVQMALDAGASGYMLTGIDAPDLLACVHGILGGRRMLVGLEGILQEDLSPLCSQEVVILREVARGLGNREIAEFLGIS